MPQGIGLAVADPRARASVGFLGLGSRPPIAEWGVDLSNGRNYLLNDWWISARPAWRS